MSKIKRGVSSHPDYIPVPKDWSCRQILLIRETQISDSNLHNLLRLQVVAWVNSKPALELRRYWRRKDGTISNRKLKGFGLEELKLIQENWEAIVTALQS